VHPFNPEAGDTPAPSDPVALAAVERSVQLLWRAFPYLGWRYGERGRRFGRSDGGYLLTLLQLDAPAALGQLDWLARVLAPRGLPSLLLEAHLETLGRLLRRQSPSEARPLLDWAGRFRVARLAALEPALFAACETRCRAAARGQPERRGAGCLIAAAVADRAAGLGSHDEALVGWFVAAAPGEAAWAEACAAVRALALGRVGPPPGLSR
jgi:hypothetical protein